MPLRIQKLAPTVCAMTLKLLPAVTPDDGPDLRHLLKGWQTFLRSGHKASGTIAGYLSRTRMYLDWCEARGYPLAIDRRQVTEWIADQLEEFAAGTVISRQVAIRRYSWWLAEEEGALEADVLVGMKPPAADEPVIEPLTVEQLGALVAACTGRGRTLRARPFRDVRDEAIVRLVAETGMRAGELVALGVGDVDTDAGIAIIRRGKMGKGRRVAFGPATSLALDRYTRKREGHRLAHTPKLFLGDGGKGFKYDALRRALGGRAEAAGLDGFHIHQLRHTMADRWLSAGGSESGLMAMAGWSRPEMLRRYTRARSESRAADEARRLNLGDL